VYNGIFGGLLVLTVVTVWVAQFDFGAANTFIAMFVATIKASLVAFFFMHLLHDERLNLITFGFGLLFVSLFFLFPLLDITSRTYVDPIKDNSSGSKYEKVLKAQNIMKRNMQINYLISVCSANQDLFFLQPMKKKLHLLL
jgi:cytochrome c oxidase subunit 4